jgi:REP element-mobilizing transposase RayT
MPRRAREKSGTGIYHVMLRGINRQNIFEEEEDYIRFKNLLYQMVWPVDDTGQQLPARCTLYAYCLMSNHVHLLIREAAEDLASVIKRIGTAYAQYYNKKYQRFGHLFQDRFKSEPVNDNAYFFTLMQYIHQNPLSAGIAKTISDYPWSSWEEYERAGNGIPMICSTKPVLDRLPIDNLRELVNEPLPKTVMVLDYDSGSVVRTDDELKAYLHDVFDIQHPTDLQQMDRERLDELLCQLKHLGASIRQIVRLTGISYGIVRAA